MVSRIRLACLVGLIVVGFGHSTSASAQGIVGGGYGGWGGYGLPYNLYGLDSIPYFALHPPVYYSRPVPRPYGYSPFAYPPGIMTPEIEVPQAKMMINPFVPRKEPAQQAGRVAVAPKLIKNPFVKRELADANEADAASQDSGPRPKVIYLGKRFR